MATAIVGREDGTEAESFDTAEQPYIWFTIKNVGALAMKSSWSSVTDTRLTSSRPWCLQTSGVVSW